MRMITVTLKFDAPTSIWDSLQRGIENVLRCFHIPAWGFTYEDQK